MPPVQFDSSPLAPDTVFARDFQIIRPIARGGMGAVYLAKQLSTGKERALKVMLPTLVSDARSRERFVQEARAGAQIESDHVVEVVAAGVDEASGAPWMAMEFLRGETLADAVERNALAPEHLRALLAQLRHAIAAAHAVGLVHRDLKPENIYLAVARRAGVPFTLKVLDFGIAKFLDAQSSARSTTALGSPLWMSPEQANATPVSPASDVWALGLIGFWLFARRVYWKSAGNEHATLSSLLTEILVEPLEPASVRAARLGLHNVLPPNFDGWFAACVDRDPGRRFREGGSALDALIACLDQSWGPGIVTNPGYAPPTSPGSPESSHVAYPTPTGIAPTVAQSFPGHTPSPFFGAPPGTPAPAASPPRRRRYLLVGLATTAITVIGGLAVAHFFGTEDDAPTTQSAPPSVTTPPIVGPPTNYPPVVPNPPVAWNQPPVAPPIAPGPVVPAQVEPSEPARPAPSAGNAHRSPAPVQHAAPVAPVHDAGAPANIAAIAPAAHDAGTTSVLPATQTTTPPPVANTTAGANEPSDDSWRYNGGPDPAVLAESRRVAQEVITRCWNIAQRHDPHHAVERTDVIVSIGVVERAYETRLPGIEDRQLQWCIQAEMQRAQFPYVRRQFTFRLRVTLSPD